MAKDKKGFLLYADQKAIFEQLTNEKAGELIKFIFSYVNDENPQTEDMLINVAFTPIKQQLKRDLQKFEETKHSRSIAGKAGANKRWQNITDDSKRIQSIAKIAVNDNDNVINTIPTESEFVAYGLSKKEDVDEVSLRLKYHSWVSSNWCTNRGGKNVKIKNWKSTLLNTLPYIQTKQQKKEPVKDKLVLEAERQIKMYGLDK